MTSLARPPQRRVNTTECARIGYHISLRGQAGRRVGFDVVGAHHDIITHGAQRGNHPLDNRDAAHLREGLEIAKAGITSACHHNTEQAHV
jgi:hypothetical protein